MLSPIFQPRVKVQGSGFFKGVQRLGYGGWERLAKRGLMPFPTTTETVTSVEAFWRGLGVDPDAPGDGILIFSAHDDDPAISVPLLLQTAIALKIPVRIAIASDGSQGYCTSENQTDIINLRRRESEDAYGKNGLGLDVELDLGWFHFKDTRLADSEGRFLRDSVSDGSLSETTKVGDGGYTGLEDAMVKELRDFNPKVVIMPTPTDLHTDHQTVAREISISIFHATGDIWPEISKRLEHVPVVFECATYCNYSAPPTVFIQGTQEMFERGLEAVLKWQSQVQIQALVDNMRRRGPIEFLRMVDWDFYEPLDNLRHFSWRAHFASLWNRFKHGKISQ